MPHAVMTAGTADHATDTSTTPAAGFVLVVAIALLLLMSLLVSVPVVP